MAICPFFGWDIANSIFDLQNLRSRSWPRSKPMVTFEAWKFKVKVTTKIDQNLIRLTFRSGPSILPKMKEMWKVFQMLLREQDSAAGGGGGASCPGARTGKKNTRTTRTPAFWGCPPPPHDYPYHWVIHTGSQVKRRQSQVTNLKNSPKFQIYEFWYKLKKRHTFWSCLIRCANMKWIWWVLLKIQSWHDSVHRWTDGQSETSIPPFQLRWSGGYNKVTLVYQAAYKVIWG